jgi:hypothetical protein
LRIPDKILFDKNICRVEWCETRYDETNIDLLIFGPLDV